MKKVPRFTSFSDSTAQDWKEIFIEQAAMFTGQADRILSHLQLLGGDSSGFPVDRLEHSLQTATLAQEGGEDDEYIVCALLHAIRTTRQRRQAVSIA